MYTPESLSDEVANMGDSSISASEDSESDTPIQKPTTKFDVQEKIKELMKMPSPSAAKVKKHFRPSHKKKGDFNKGVAHKIKKPKIIKAKDKRLNKAKQTVTRIKEVKMPPRFAANRISVKSDDQKVVRHKLSSPGLSLLDSPDSHNMRVPNELKFFTSRSRTAATVKINNAVKLSAINGEITIHPKEGGFEKKNIGKHIELELEKKLSTSLQPTVTPCTRLEDACPLSSVASRSTPPKLTRFPGSPSPRKPPRSALSLTPTRSSPRKHLLKKIYSPKASKTHRKKEVQRSLANQSGYSPIADTLNNNVEPQILDSTPAHDSNSTISQNGHSTQNGQVKDLDDLDLALDQVESDTHEDEILKSLLKQNETPEKTPRRRSPRKLQSSPRATKDTTNDTTAANSPVKEQNVKYFQIFEPKSRMTKRPIDTKSKPKNINPPGKKFLLKKSERSQLIIDAGQKEYGASFCKGCGILYEAGDPEDEENHAKFHDGVALNLKFNGWKNERQVTNLDHLGGRIIQVCPRDGPHRWRKVRDVLECVDADLGFSESGIRSTEGTSAFLYVHGKQIVGVLVAESIEKAYQVIQQDTKPSENAEMNKLICCSETAEKVSFGISRIWVLPSFRERGIATKLVDGMRANIVPYHYLKVKDFAFSDPSLSGMRFAEKYTKRSNFLVYRRE